MLNSTRYERYAAMFLSIALIAACSKTGAPTSSGTETLGSGQGSTAQTQVPLSPDDPHSFANTQDYLVKHARLDLRVDFSERKLKGHVELSVHPVKAERPALVLDTRDLEIGGVQWRSAGGEWRSTGYRLGAKHEMLGAPLLIDVPAEVGADDFTVRVQYVTSPQASGLQWLDPAQTAGKKQPYLYSQSQAIHGRSWIPLQDTPRVRLTYDAHIETPPELLAVMSANNDPETARDGSYDFSMPQPIPSYLIALGVGDFRFRAISNRTGVYAEPEVLSAAAYEFGEVEKMVAACEKMFGAYRWGRYDLLILPPSFMWGGMENPRLSFITPTSIAGDRSLVSLIAHELAHSWSGNLVTNANWESTWLNEGITTYIERRIVEVLYGKDRMAMEDVLGLQSLRHDIDELASKGDGALTKLRMDLQGRDPDEAFSDVSYEKGRFFVGFLESRVGRPRLDSFLRDYFEHYAFQSATTDQFLDFLRDRFLIQAKTDFSNEEVRAWIDEPGIPATLVEPKSDAFKLVDAQRDLWLKGTRKASALQTKNWNTQQWLHFIDNLPADINAERLAELDKAFRLTQAHNNAIAHSWLLVAIRAQYAPANERLAEYLTTIGRRKFVKDLYEALAKTPDGLSLAKSIYAQARPLYQVPLVAQLDKLIGST